MSRLVFVLLALAVACEAARLSSKRGLLAKKRLYANQARQVTDEVVVAGPDTALSGVITSPNYPSDYPNYQDLGWVISAPQENTINIVMEDFDLEYHTSCTWDSLKIYDGADANGALLGTYCGDSANGLELSSSSNTLYVVFHSDYSVTAGGFSLNWDISACRGPLILTEEGEIMSENYGVGSYSNHLSCTWRITAPADKMIAVTFSTFSVEYGYSCSYDALRVYDGDNTEAPELAELCGFDLPGPIVSSSNELTLNFDTDYSVTYPGFHLEFFFVDDQLMPELFDVNMLTSIVQGDTVPLTEEGLIESPNMATGDANYDNHEHNQWIITAPAGQGVMLAFNSFGLEYAGGCIYDSLVVYDGASASAPVIANLCGYSTPPNLISSGESLFLVFSSDYSVTGPGFSIMATFTAYESELTAVADAGQACAGTAEISDSMIIQSPNYGYGYYPNDAACRWIISNPGVATLHFESFSVESHSSCSYDDLSIYQSSEAEGTPIAKLCGYTLPETITSTASQLLLVFSTDHSVTSSGFRLDVLLSPPAKRAPAPAKRAPVPAKRAPVPAKRAPVPAKRAPAPAKRAPAPAKIMRMPESKLGRLFKRKFH